MQRVDGDEHHIIVLIDDFDDLLHGVPVGNAHQAAELAHAVIHVHHIVADIELLKLFQRQGDLSAACLVAPQVILVETVENLVVGEKACLQVVVGKTGMQSLVHGRELDARSLLLENSRQAVGLLRGVG